MNQSERTRISRERWRMSALRRGLWVRHLLGRRSFVAGRVLEIGCGHGGVLAGIAGDGNTAVGVDVDEARLRSARSTYPSIQIVQANGALLPFRNEAFDVAILFGVLEHIREWRAVLGETERVLTRRGVAYITAVNRRSPITVVDDPHWGLPLLAVMSPAIGKRILATLRVPGLEMGGDFPHFPSWRELHDGALDVGLNLELLTVREKLQHADAAASPVIRRSAGRLEDSSVNRRVFNSWLGHALTRSWDRHLARGWEFLATKIH